MDRVPDGGARGGARGPERELPRVLRALQRSPNIQYRQTDGRRLPGVGDGAVDFVWSYDVFVHMERDVIDGYLGEMTCVLRPGGAAVLHHPGRRTRRPGWASSGAAP
jgi:hypothetical protein